MENELPEDLWAPLYDRINYTKYGKAFYEENNLVWWVNNPEAVRMYRRACQRYYGDSRPDHIQW